MTTAERNLDGGAAPPLSDAQLVRASLRDRERFWQLYERYVDAIYWYALPRTRSAAVADDIVSETMLAAFEHIASFDPDKGSFAAWLFVIARRKLIDQQRAHRRFWRYVRRHGTVHEISVDEELLTRILRDEEITTVYSAFEQLSSDDQDILALRYSAGLSTRDIANILKINDAAARQRLTRARQRIARRLGEVQEEDDD